VTSRSELLVKCLGRASVQERRTALAD